MNKLILGKISDYVFTVQYLVFGLVLDIFLIPKIRVPMSQGVQLVDRPDHIEIINHSKLFTVQWVMKVEYTKIDQNFAVVHWALL